MKFPTTGLYAITQPEEKSLEAVTLDVEAALKGGAKVVQYRDKSPINAELLATQLLNLCHQYHAPLIINDHIELAKKIGAHGVHLGQHDQALKKARDVLGANAIIGISCYNDLQKAISAQQQGADYVAFGRFFPSTSKPLASPANIEILSLASRCINIPIVAIGGIVPENGKQLLDAGADLLAVIGGIFNHNPEQSAKNLAQLFK